MNEIAGIMWALWALAGIAALEFLGCRATIRLVLAWAWDWMSGPFRDESPTMYAVATKSAALDRVINAEQIKGVRYFDGIAELDIASPEVAPGYVGQEDEPPLGECLW